MPDRRRRRLEKPAARLTLGPLLFGWPSEACRDFYFRIADEAPVDAVYVGEVVCAKRETMHTAALAAAIERLRVAGKEVVLSTLALVATPRDRESVRALAENRDLMVEANDLTAVALVGGRPHCLGPYVNVYNEGTLAFLAARGAVRVCLPVELDHRAIAALAAAARTLPRPVAIEVQVFGRLPLALSARCYHARAHRLSKDTCRTVCAEDPDGLEVVTLGGEPFLAINGTQTLSVAYGNLLGELRVLRDAGASVFRLSPHRVDMVAVARLFRDVLDGRMAADEADARVRALVGPQIFANGYVHGRAGGVFVAAS